MSTNIPSAGSDSSNSDSALNVAADLRSSLFKAQFGLDIALCVGSLGCVVGLLFLRRKSGYDLRTLPMWTVMGSLIAIFLFEIFNLPEVSQNWSKATKQPESYVAFYYPGLILASFFRHVAMCSLFYIFYQMTHLCTHHSTDGTKPRSNIRILHWTIFAIIVATAIIDWAFYTHQIVVLKTRAGKRGGTSNYGTVLRREQTMDSATQIIRWIASAEILAWNIFVVTKAMRFYPKLRVSTVFLLFGSVFFFALNMMWAIFDINYFLTLENLVNTSIAGVNMTQAVFLIVLYVGILPFCLRWGLLQKKASADDVEHKGRQDRSPVEVEDNSISYHFAEAHSRMVLEAAEPKQIFEADPAAAVVEADSKPLHGHSPAYTGVDTPRHIK